MKSSQFDYDRAWARRFSKSTAALQLVHVLCTDCLLMHFIWILSYRDNLGEYRLNQHCSTVLSYRPLSTQPPALPPWVWATAVCMRFFIHHACLCSERSSVFVSGQRLVRTTATITPLLVMLWADEPCVWHLFSLKASGYMRFMHHSFLCVLACHLASTLSICIAALQWIAAHMSLTLNHPSGGWSRSCPLGTNRLHTPKLQSWKVAKGMRAGYSGERDQTQEANRRTLQKCDAVFRPELLSKEDSEGFLVLALYVHALSALPTCWSASIVTSISYHETKKGIWKWFLHKASLHALSPWRRAAVLDVLGSRSLSEIAK